MKPFISRLASWGLCAALFVGCPGSRLFAADGTWNNTAGGTLSWASAANWSGGIAAGGTDAIANFATVNIGANTTVTLTGTNPTVGTLLFADTSGAQTWGINNTGTINLSVTSGSPFISNSVTSTLNAIFAGSQGFTKLGSGVLILGGANTYSGNMVISEGFLRLGTSDTLPNDSVVVFANNANNKELTVFSASDTIGGLSSSGGAGTIVVQNNRALNTGTLNLNVAAATSLTYDGFIRDSGAGVAVNNLNIIKSGPGTQVFSGGANVSYSGATTVNDGTLEFSGTTVNNNSAIDVAGSNAAIRFNIASGNLVRTNTISGAGSLVKAGTHSALTLSNVNTYTGSTVLEEGFIRLGASDRIANASVLRFATTNDARFQMQGFNETLGGLDSGSSSGTQVIEGATNAAATLTLSVGSGSYTYSGQLRDAASGTNANNLSLVKDGAGTQVLSGSQIKYSGGTTVNGGNLVISNSALTATISPSNLVVNFDTNSPIAGPYSILGGSLASASLASATVTAAGGSLPNGLTASFTNSPNLQVILTQSSVTPTITAGGTLSALSTTFGTASSSISFTVSGANMNEGILVTPPSGFEVSTDNLTFSPFVTVGAAGTINSTTIYVRLAAIATVAGSPYSGNIVLRSGATSVNLATVSSTVAKATPLITTPPTASAITYGQTLAASSLTGGAGSVDGSFAFTSPSTAPSTGTANQGVTFTPNDTANYNTATESVSVTVLSLAQAFFGDLNPTNLGPDGASMLLRYAFGATTNGNVDRTLMPAASLSGSDLVMTYYARTNDTNLSVVPWVNTDLSSSNTWNTNGIIVANIGTLNTNGTILEKRTATVPQGSDTRKFLRLKVTLTNP
jgi:autotransporter-associated beta strand protein